MKRISMIAAIAAALVMGLSSCRKECPCDHSQFQQGTSTQWNILKYTIKADNWELCEDNEGLNPFFRATLNVPELTKNIVDEGAAIAYVDYGSSQQAMPLVRHFQKPFTNEDGTTGMDYWTQTIDFEFAVGKAYIYATNSDFYVQENPGDLSVRIVLIY